MGKKYFCNVEYTQDEKKLTEQIIVLEKSALDRWFKGDTSGYRALWSKKNFTYFDAMSPDRIDDFRTIEKFVLENVEGKLFAESYDFYNPRIQFGKDIAVLTYQLYAKTNIINMRYNCVEIFQKEDNGEWHVIHSNWSFIRPMDLDFSVFRSIV